MGHNLLEINLLANFEPKDQGSVNLNSDPQFCFVLNFVLSQNKIRVWNWDFLTWRVSIIEE